MDPIADLDQLPLGLIVRHLPARVQATVEEGPGGQAWRWEYRSAVSAMADATIVGFAAFRWDGERWVPRHPDNAFFTTGDFAEWYGAPAGKVPAGAECADTANFCTAAEFVAERVKWVYVAESGGRRVKGEAVVELLAELEEHAQAPATPAGRLAADAALFRKTMLQHTGRSLDYDEAGVRWLDSHVARNRETLRTSSADFHAAGAWFGECLRRVYGGQWVANVNGEQWGLQIDAQRLLFPFNRLYRLVAGESGAESLASLYLSLASAQAAAADQAPAVAAAAATPPGGLPLLSPRPYAPPRPPWKFWKK